MYLDKYTYTYIITHTCIHLHTHTHMYVCGYVYCLNVFLLYLYSLSEWFFCIIAFIFT